MTRRGFTLLEVLVSIGLIMVLLGSMFAFLIDMMGSRRRVIDYTGRRRAAAALIERVEADLRTCLVGDRAGGAGIEGDETRVLITSRGVAIHLADRGAQDPEVFGDRQQSEYRFNDEVGEIEARRGTGDWASLGRVSKVRFRYHDSTRWRDSFDTLAEERLPVAVEVAVWIDPWPGESETPTEPQLERLTFDVSGGFDEAEAARRTDLDLFDEPQPDRFRVILIADAAPPDDNQPPEDNQEPEP